MNVLWTINVLQPILCTTQRFLNFKHKNEKCTKLSKYIWYLKSQGITPIVKWSIVKRVNSKTAANYCKLCLTEKFYIIQSLDDKNLLNKKSELVNKCRHQINLLLSNIRRNDFVFCTRYFCFCLFQVNKICKVDSMPDECSGRKLRVA